MNDKLNTFPVGMQLLGRALNASGEPIDKKGPLAGVERAPLYGPVSGDAGTAPADQVLETGIKVIDLLAPIPRGGIAGIFGNTGVGKLVVIEEIMYDLVTRHNGYIVGLGMGESTYEADELMEPIREAEIEDKLVIVFEQMTDSLEVWQRMTQAGLTIAGYFQQQGHETLLVTDKNMTEKGGLAIIRELRRVSKEKRVTAILQGAVDESKQFQQGDLDCWILLTREMAKHELWPAIDRLLSSSRLLDSGVAGSEHVQVARQVRELLRRYAELETKEPQELSEADKQLIKRAQKIQFFFTQPFFVAEPYTEIPGEYARLEDTVKGFKELLEGRYDELPEQAFYFVGGIEQAIAKSSHTG